MKKLLLVFLGTVSMLSAGLLKAQTFTMQSAPSDTVIVTPFAEVFAPTNNIKNITGSPLSIRWQVIASNFPLDWLTAGAFGICDAHLCRANASNALWDSTAGSGGIFTCTYGANSTHDSVGLFDLTMDLTHATTVGTRYVTIRLTDMGSSYSKNITFILTKIPTAVPSISNAVSEVSLYPNPAHNEINAVYDAGADVKTIAVYNVIGKAMLVYKVSNTSANLNIENLPSGVYFVRLMNSGGNVVATKKFTKQ